MTKSPVLRVTADSTGASDYVTLDSPVKATLDISVPSTRSIEYTIQSRSANESDAEWITIPQAADETTDLTITNKSFAGEVTGARQWRINIASLSGTGDVIISIDEADAR